MSQPSLESKQKWLNANRHRRPEINRSNRLRNFYGISPETPQNMKAEQDNKCLICLRPFGLDVEPHIEHDHLSGWVRGIVCEECNFGLGKFGDDVEVMQRAVEYLISNATPTEFNIGAARAALKQKSCGNRTVRTEEDLARLRQAGFQEGATPWNKKGAHSDEARKKMGKSQRERWVNASEEQKKRHSELGRLNAKKRWEKT